MKLRFLLLFTCCIWVVSQAQEFPHNYFRAPLDIPMYLSGNFGELRSDHYHSGIDIKTQGREGHKVFAAADGFVSRIKVSPYGYGNALYIDHPNGYTTVYGHLQSFSPKIDSVVKQYQYSKESFAIDEALSSGVLKIQKGEVVALSGNSGSSGGPHLHFEIRETATELPTNPLLYGFDIKDGVAPVIRSLFVYDINGANTQRNQYSLVKEGKSYSIKGNKEPIVSGKLGIALDVRDYMNTTHNYYGIYHLELYVDEQLQHRFTFDKFSFAESRYMNAHIDYELYKTHKKRVHKLFHEENHEESFTSVVNQGIVFQDAAKHPIRILISDAYGNAIDLAFTVQSQPKQHVENLAKKMLYAMQDNTLETAEFFAKIPSKALYRSIEKKTIHQTTCTHPNSYSPLFELLDETIPLHKNVTVGIAPKNLPASMREQAFVARKTGNNYRFVGNKWDGSYLTGKTKRTGDFVVLVDTTAPEISLWKGRSYQKTGKLRYKITDNLSGIASYRGLIDGKWVLFEYDAKRRLLWHTLTANKINRGKKHNLVLEVKDACGNVAVRKASFTW